MSQQVIIPSNLGKTLKAHHLAANKYDVQIDGDTLTVDAAGKISVDTAALNIVIVSTDAGQVINTGTDGGALFTKETFEDLVGDMVVSATDGLTYDDAIGALTAAVASATGGNTDSVAVNASLSGGVLTIEAKVIIDPVATNLLTVTSDGLLVDVAAIAAATTNDHKVLTDDAFQTFVNGVMAESDLTEITDAFGVHIGDMFAD